MKQTIEINLKRNQSLARGGPCVCGGLNKTKLIKRYDAFNIVENIATS